MADNAEKSGATSCLEISLRPEASHLKASDGRDISFTKAILTIRNQCDVALEGVMPHVTLGQEGGTVQDVTGALSHATSSSIPAGGSVNWDVYDLLIPAHPGTASKVHMFGYRAALNWIFDLAAWAEYRSPAAPDPVKTPVVRWSFRWSIADPASGTVGLTVDQAKG
jgi:hypothetical protein